MGEWIGDGIGDLFERDACHDFFYAAEHIGLPVQYLREVVWNKNYFFYAGDSHYWSWHNSITLQTSDYDEMRRFSLQVAGAQDTVCNIYHEFTHAWFDINKNTPAILQLAARGREYYKECPLKDTLSNSEIIADDENRVFEEAAAMYCAYRTSSWWSILTTLIWQSRTMNNEKATPSGRALAIALAKKCRRDYDEQMAKRAFGYQDRSLLWRLLHPKAEPQAFTTKPILGELRDFCDRVLLENKISDQFERSGAPANVWRSMQAAHPELL